MTKSNIIYVVSLENTNLTLDLNLHHYGELLNLTLQLKDKVKFVYVNHSNIDNLLDINIDNSICFLHEGVWSYYNTYIRELNTKENILKNIKFIDRFKEIYTDKYSIKNYGNRIINRVYLPDLFGIINEKLILGDSHSLSYIKKGFDLERNDGKTLNRFLNEKINIKNDKYSELIFYAGNIDVINHFYKHNYDDKKCFEIVNKLVCQLNTLNINYKISELIKINIYNDKLRLDKYVNTEGNRCSGTQKYIHNMVDKFNNYLHELTDNIISLDLEYNKNGIITEQMADNDGLHIKPKHYKYIKKENF